MYDFKEQLKKDWVKEAEQKCYEYLSSEGKRVIDVSEDENYFKYGIDLIIQEPRGEVYIDVKADTVIHATNNLFFEVIECFWKTGRSDTKNGWGLNRQVQYIFYVDIKNWILYIFDNMELYKYFYEQNSVECKLIPHENYKTLGFLASLDDIEHLIIKRVNL